VTRSRCCAPRSRSGTVHRSPIRRRRSDARPAGASLPHRPPTGITRNRPEAGDLRHRATAEAGCVDRSTTSLGSRLRALPLSLAVENHHWPAETMPRFGCCLSPLVNVCDEFSGGKRGTISGARCPVPGPGNVTASASVFRRDPLSTLRRIRSLTSTGAPCGVRLPSQACDLGSIGYLPSDGVLKLSVFKF
jgi:hypothetical protein